MFACNCLNVIIEVENDFEKVNWETLDLSEDEKLDTFFKQEIVKVQKLLKINKSHSGLVQVKKVGSWNVNRCLNCDVHTHAVHKEKGASFVLIYAKLLNSEAIANIKSSDLYSTIFNIVVNPNDVGYDNAVIDTYHNKAADKIIKNINEVVSNYIRKEQAAVEERIRQFRDKQYEILNGLKDRAYKECEALARVVQSAMSEPVSTNQEQYYQTPRKSLGLSDTVGNNVISVPGSPLSMGHSPKRPKSSLVESKHSDKDEDLIFDFEGADVNASNPALDVDFDSEIDMEDDDSDKERIDDNDADIDEEDDDVGISFKTSKSKSLPSIAKSLPVTIPAFTKYSRSKSQRDPEDTDDLPPEENVDIAASIKALAKSVHGDAIFGELPRPRFSSQI